MTPDQIREVVKMTIEELTERKLINPDNYQTILMVVENRLNEYFSGKTDNKLTHVLRQLSDDPYLDIIFLQYRDDKTREWIAELFEVDISTIRRNKKRLIIKIYELLEEL